jgi:hypothetical protein
MKAWRADFPVLLISSVEELQQHSQLNQSTDVRIMCESNALTSSSCFDASHQEKPNSGRDCATNRPTPSSSRLMNIIATIIIDELIGVRELQS